MVVEDKWLKLSNDERAKEREREKKKKMKTKDNCFLCIYVDDIECSSRLTYSNPSSIHIQQQWFLFFLLSCSPTRTHTHTHKRSIDIQLHHAYASIHSLVLTAVIFFSEQQQQSLFLRGEMNEIELVIKSRRRT